MKIAAIGFLIAEQIIDFNGSVSLSTVAISTNLVKKYETDVPFTDFTNAGCLSYELKTVPLFRGQSTYNALNTNITLVNRDLPNNNYQYTPSDQSFGFYPTAIKFAWQIRVTKQFENPVTANDGNSNALCFAFNNVNQPPHNLAVNGIASGVTNRCETNSGTKVLTVTGRTEFYVYLWKSVMPNRTSDDLVSIL